MRFILCIDDDPIRYRNLQELLLSDSATEDIRLLLTCRLDDVIEYLRGHYTLFGVCLDHDMPGRNGQYYAGILRDRNFPVAITSLNPDGAKAIKYLLDGYCTENILSPCSSLENRGWEIDVVNFFQENWDVRTRVRASKEGSHV